MKEKNKNVLKGLAVGTLALVGMAGLTGCSQIEVSQQKVDSMIETVDKVDSSLDQYVDLLEQQNNLLQQQNNILQQQNGQLQEQNNNLEQIIENSKRMTKEEVWNLAQRADYNFMMNVDGVRNNCVMTGNGNGETVEQIFYNSANFKAAFAQGEELLFVYQTNESNVIATVFTFDGTNYACSSVSDMGADEDFENFVDMYSPEGLGLTRMGFTYEELNHYEQLENGNVKLYFSEYLTLKSKTEGESATVLKNTTFEYSSDGKLLSINMDSRVIEVNGEFEGEEGLLEEQNMNVEMTCSYGTVDVDFIESLIALAEAKRAEK